MGFFTSIRATWATWQEKRATERARKNFEKEARNRSTSEVRESVNESLTRAPSLSFALTHNKVLPNNSNLNNNNLSLPFNNTSPVNNNNNYDYHHKHSKHNNNVLHIVDENSSSLSVDDNGILIKQMNSNNQNSLRSSNSSKESESLEASPSPLPAPCHAANFPYLTNNNLFSHSDSSNHINTVTVTQNNKNEFANQQLLDDESMALQLQAEEYYYQSDNHSETKQNINNSNNLSNDNNNVNNNNVIRVPRELRVENLSLSPLSPNPSNSSNSDDPKTPTGIGRSYSYSVPAFLSTSGSASSSIHNSNNNQINNNNSIISNIDRLSSSSNRIVSSRSQIKNLPTFAFTPPRTDNNKNNTENKADDTNNNNLSKLNDNDSCSICLCDFIPGVPLKMLPCVHRFHVECIDDWLTKATLCPVCNFDITKAYLTVASPKA